MESKRKKRNAVGGGVSARHPRKAAAARVAGSLACAAALIGCSGESEHGTLDPSGDSVGSGSAALDRLRFPRRRDWAVGESEHEHRHHHDAGAGRDAAADAANEGGSEQDAGADAEEGDGTVAADGGAEDAGPPDTTSGGPDAASEDAPADGAGSAPDVVEEAQGADATIDAGGPPDAGGLLTGATAVGSGENFACALLGDGTVVCWGVNDQGQLGDGTGVGSPIPVRVAGLSGVTGIAVANLNACALSGGSVFCWGAGTTGVLGQFPGPNTCGTNGCALAPVKIPNLTTGVGLGLGLNTGCAVLAGGTAECWGGNLDGQLGNGSSATIAISPVPVTGVSNAIAISVGILDACVLLGDGTVECWGSNGSGQLGRPTTGPQICPNDRFACSTTPVAISGLSGATALAVADNHVCTLSSGPSPQCWGLNLNGQLGDGVMTGPDVCANPSPAPAPGEAVCSIAPVTVSAVTNATAITAGAAQSCALLSGGTVECWGALWGATPTAVAGLSGVTFVELENVAGTPCAIVGGGIVQCGWGPSSPPSPIPAPAPPQAD